MAMVVLIDFGIIVRRHVVCLGCHSPFERNSRCERAASSINRVSNESGQVEAREAFVSLINEQATRSISIKLS